ncbi:MarR family winged helix-turn-helix transcriptional regulator [Marinimicrobium agarilyticum]|uniref:MarR family winged helix-turn-helix transcriptional regulator n=1 Tax=Marinimicrobium agarilyticum TaxID=306546 RepID=UPI0004210EAF|nr:MarR family transcriptional regulator [Marinimicrobium agarilyticum]
MLGSDRTAGSAFHLHNSFTFWIARLASCMREAFNEALAEHDVSWPQWMILNVLFHELANTPAQIADNIAVDRSAVTRLLDRLEAKDLVQREHDGLDRRSVKIHLTRAGKQLVQNLNEQAVNHQNRFLNQLHPTELRAFKGNIQKLLRAVDIDSSQLWKHV